MSESIHTVRWIRQLEGLGWDIHLFPSWGFDIHRELKDVTIHGRSRPFPRGSLPPTVRLNGRVWPLPYNALYGKYHWLFPPRNDDDARLATLIADLRPDVLHSLEIQHAGYLTLEAKRHCRGAW